MLNTCTSISSFLQKVCRNYHHLLFQQVNRSHSHINKIMQHSISCLANSVDHDQPLSDEAGWSGSTLFAMSPECWSREKEWIILTHNLYNTCIKIFNFLINDRAEIPLAMKKETLADLGLHSFKKMIFNFEKFMHTVHCTYYPWQSRRNIVLALSVRPFRPEPYLSSCCSDSFLV